MNYSKIFNYTMITIVIISAIMSFLAPLYLSEKELIILMNNLAGKR